MYPIEFVLSFIIFFYIAFYYLYHTILNLWKTKNQVTAKKIMKQIYKIFWNGWYRKLLNTPFRDKPHRLSRSGAFIELPALNAPFRDNRGGGGLSRKGVPVPTPTPFPSRSHNPFIRDKPRGTVLRFPRRVREE